MIVNTSEILWARLNDKVKNIPTKRYEDAGFDIYTTYNSNIDPTIILKPGKTELFPTGLGCVLHPGFYLQLEEKSGRTKSGYKISGGIIDSGYRGEIFVPITNITNHNLYFLNNYHGENDLTNKNDEYAKVFNLNRDHIVYVDKAICQAIIHRNHCLESKEITKEAFLNDYPSLRGDGGFGSTNK
jgi:dUTP pyrophosphatase